MSSGDNGVRGDAAPILDHGVLERLAMDTSPAVAPHLIEMFLADCAERCSHMARALATEDRETIERQSHTLASSAVTFGAMRLHHRAAEIEEACKRGDWTLALERAGTMADLGRVTAQAMEAYLAASSHLPHGGEIP
jgi:HPt (histidine-containing phosphotransfer) domain-containing protein